MKYIASFHTFRMVGSRVEPVASEGEHQFDVTQYVTSQVHPQDLPWFLIGAIDNSDLGRLHITPEWIRNWRLSDKPYMITVEETA